jgi:hypothetical protein
MPIVINELVIKATIDETNAAQPTPSAGGLEEIDRKVLVEQCVEEVLKVLRRREER